MTPYAVVFQVARPWGVSIIVAFVAVLQFAVADETPGAVLVLLSSLGVGLIVVGGYAANDFVDRDLDKVAHPERPLPSGRLQPQTMLILVLVAFLGGLTALYFVGLDSLLVGGLLVAALVAYSPTKNFSGLLGSQPLNHFIIGFDPAEGHGPHALRLAGFDVI